jgi:CubicO group peptidase (beta-lactamase class C family)
MSTMRRWLSIAVLAVSLGCASASPRLDDPTPVTLEEFKAAAQHVLDEARLPGAGFALVRADGIEWAGGLGWADRDARRPVDADTHFRVGSIGKTFVALALVQLYEDGKVDLDATVASLVPDVEIDNPWEATDPVRVRHLLEHTAGFDDMHLNEVYVVGDTPDRPLEDVLRLNPASRRVRWRPGTRMAYSNPGYALAARVVEVVSGKPYDQFISERILTPLEMTTSGFAVAPDDDAALAQGYAGPVGGPVVRRRIHLRPAGALTTSARELGQFVEMLLGWGERRGNYVVDPEYLSNMEWPRTTVASTAGVRAGYGLGIFSTIDLPFHVLGHQGGIDGFVSAYGYSPSRDVGYVVLLNGTYAPEALTRLSSLAIRYLKRDVEPPAPDRIAVAPADLERFEGYYHDANPRHALFGAVEFPLSGRVVRVRDGRLTLSSLLGRAEPLVPVNDALFRREDEVAASMAFTSVDEQPVLAGIDVYAERRARWPIELQRVGLVSALGLVVLAPVLALARWWRGRHLGWARSPGLGVTWTITLFAFLGIFAAAATAAEIDLAVPTLRSWTVYWLSALYPLLAGTLLPLTAVAWRRGVGRAFAVFAGAVAAAHVGLAGYLGWWGLIAFRSWTY